MGLALLVLAISPLVIPAGSSQELATSLASQTGAPVVVMLDPGKLRWPAIRIEREKLTIKDIDRLIAAKLGSSTFPIETYGLASPAWPEFFRSTVNRAIYEREVSGSYSRGQLSWKITPEGVQAKSEGGAIEIQTVLAKFDPPVSYHQFFKGARVVLDAPITPTNRLLKTIAASIGARVRKTEKGAHLEIDTASYRARTLADYRRTADMDHAGLSQSAQFSLLALQNVPDDVLAKALAEDATSEPIYWKNLPAQVATGANRKVYLAITQSKGKVAGEELLEKWRKDFDLDHPVIQVSVAGFGIAYPHRDTPGAFMTVF